MGSCQSKLGWDPATIPKAQQICRLKGFLETVKTGDMILFQGNGCASCMIRCMSPCNTWSHVGMVIVHEEKIMVTEAYDEIIACDVLRGDYHVGIQFVDLAVRLKEYESHRVAYRRLSGEVDSRKTDDLVQRYCELKKESVPLYNKDIIDFLEYGTRTDDDDNVHNGKKHYICTSWFAALMMHFEIVTTDISPGNYTLADYGMTYRQMCTLTDKFCFESIKYIFV